MGIGWALVRIVRPVLSVIAVVVEERRYLYTMGFTTTAPSAMMSTAAMSTPTTMSPTCSTTTPSPSTPTATLLPPGCVEARRT